MRLNDFGKVNFFPGGENVKGKLPSAESTDA